MATVARDLDYILIHRVSAVVAAIFRVTRHCAGARVVFTLVIVCHNFSPLDKSNFAAYGNA